MRSNVYGDAADFVNFAFPKTLKYKYLENKYYFFFKYTNLFIINSWL